MNAPSANMDDLESDIRHLSVLIDTITDIAFDAPTPIDERVTALLWIARDLAKANAEAAAACHSKIMRERRAMGGQ